MSFFESVKMAPSDPILGLQEQFLKDPRSNKVNLSIGAYANEQLKPWVLPSLQQALEKQMEQLDTKYLPMKGDGGYLEALKQLLKLDQATAAVQTIGGTGALSIAGLFLKQYYDAIWLPNLTWGNHKKVFAHAGLDLKTYPYFDRNTSVIDSAFFSFLKEQTRSLIVFHACCHNPTGRDLDREQLVHFANLVKEKGHLVLFDMAYHGFGEGLEQDRFVLDLFAEKKIPYILSYTCSKNFALYGYRTGALFFVQMDQHHEIESQLATLIRSCYSSPPKVGAFAVKTILSDQKLFRLWEQELTVMRNRLAQMRLLIKQNLKDVLSPSEIEGLNNEKGMFSLLPLSSENVALLIQEYGIYLTSDGRINLAGLNEDNISYVCQAIDEVKHGACQKG